MKAYRPYMAQNRWLNTFTQTVNRNRTLCVVAVCFFALAIAAGLSRGPGPVDWLAASEWSHFVGAEDTEKGVKITSTERAINHRDTSMAQPDPPVNTRGAHLEVNSEFNIDMKLSGINNEATVQFYGEVPVIYDEWRHEKPSIQIRIKNDGVYARIWDGTSASPLDERTFNQVIQDTARLSLHHENNRLVIRIDDKTLGDIPDHRIFESGKVWFGADAKPETNGWVIRELTAQSKEEDGVKIIPSLSLTTSYNDPNLLRNLAAAHPRQIPIGAAIASGPLLTDAKYNELAIGNFSMITPENSLKPQFVHPQKDRYLFQDTDILVEVAQKNQMVVHGHSLVMGKANPEWMQKSSEEERKQIMIDHVTTVVGHYKGKIAQWDVVNEPLSEDDVDYSSELNGIRKQMWLDAMGEEYIDIAFKAARAADPEAKLYLNDFGIEKDGKRWDALVSLVKRLQSRGVPIDGVGFESHVYHTPADTIDPVVLKQHIQTLASLGIVSRISEIDVLGDDSAVQAQQYGDVLEACLSEPTCTSYGIWGITDRYGSTALSDRYPINLGDSLLWDENYQAKPALEALRSVLRQQ